MALSDELLLSKIQARRLADGSDCQLDARYPSLRQCPPGVNGLGTGAWAESGEKSASPSLHGYGVGWRGWRLFLAALGLTLPTGHYTTNLTKFLSIIPDTHTCFLSGIGGDLPPTFSSKSKLHLHRPGATGSNGYHHPAHSAVTSIAFWKLSPVPPVPPRAPVPSSRK